ncbi:MAG: hypothetical protein DHS20C21_03630 [Gemmatimonadota bacterium]|nr:MAG: hypothetical protein DHS20C21_03630 [Gemmatimonadota bacterium]
MHVLVVGGVVAMAPICALIGEDAYWWFTGEEGFVEVWQVVFFALAGVFALRARAVLARLGERGLSRWFLLAAVGLFLLVGEEISWGQRLFGWATPENLAAINRQGETTLHNIQGLHEIMGLGQMLLGAYGALLPFWVQRYRGPGSRLVRAFVPAVRFAPYFAPVLLWRIYRELGPLPSGRAYALTQLNEVFELTLSIGIFLLFQDAFRRARAGAL